MAILDTIVSRFGRGSAESAPAVASRVPSALRFSKFRTREEFEAAGRELDDRFARATTDAERAAIQQEINSLQSAFLKFENAPAAKGARFGDEPISQNERMVLQSKYGEDRVLDPVTGYPQSVGGQPLRYETRDPFMAMGERLGQLEGRPSQSPSGINYLFEKSRALGVDGKPIMKVGPTGQFEKFEGFTPGQRLAQVGAAGTVGGALATTGSRSPATEFGDEFGYAGRSGEELQRTLVGEPGFSGPSGDMLQRALSVTQANQPPAPAAIPQIMTRFGINQFKNPDRSISIAAPAPAVNAATVEAPIPPKRQREEPSMLARALSTVYNSDYQKGMSSREMFEQAQRDRDESPAAYFRAASRAREEMEARATGGAANGKVHKDAALHKALEIIQMMLSRR